MRKKSVPVSALDLFYYSCEKQNKSVSNHAIGMEANGELRDYGISTTLHEWFRAIMQRTTINFRILYGKNQLITE
jgi:hypothetical protein